MEKLDKKYMAYLQILKDELIPATGCTEPISIALAAAKAREILGVLPEHVTIKVSENIMKNAKSVIVPNTNQLKGIKAAVAAGLIAGKTERNLDVISDVTDADKDRISNCSNFCVIDVIPVDSEYVYDIQITAKKGESYSKVRIIDFHTNFILIEKDGEILYEKTVINDISTHREDRKLLNVKDIIEFADSVEIEDVEDVLARQIRLNLEISDEGLINSYGANIGSVLLSANGTDIQNRAKAKTAAASDARMSGSKLPVVIVSGSGNQGLTASIPVIEYAKDLGVTSEKLYRALVVSNLITIHQKTGIGSLSAYCGAVSAGAGSGAGIAYLHGGGYDAIAHTMVNALAIISGMICDGAKPSCAAKIAASVESGILGYHMYLRKQEFLAGDGIIAKGVEETLSNITRLANEGMRGTDREIVKMMLENI